MPTSEAKRTEKFIFASLLAHLALFVLVIASNRLFPSSAKLYLPAIQVDMVALPSEAKNNNAQVVDPTLPVKDKAPPPEPIKEEVKKTTPVPVPVKAAPTPAPIPVAKPAKIKNPEVAAESAIEKLKREVNKEKAAEQQKQKEELKKFQERYRSVNRGNQLHQGTSMSGTMESTMNAYGAHITDVLRSNWIIPVWLQSEKLRAAVRIYIDAKGKVMSFQFLQKSGNEVFDNCVKSAINNSNFAPPPAEMAPGLRSSGIEVLFPI